MLKILLVLLYLSAFYFLQSRVRIWIKGLAKQKQVSPARAALVTRFFIGLLMFTTVSLLAVTLGFGYQDITVFVSSMFAILGVAFIAQWSILSNIASGVLIFFVFPYRIGERIKVVDKDEDISGTIKEIALFHVLIRRDNGDVVTYPNSLILQKPVLKLAPKPVPAPEVIEVKKEETPAPIDPVTEIKA